MDLSPTELAATDAEYIQSLHDFTPDANGDINLKSASGLFKRLANSVPASERNGIITNEGKAGTEGIKRVKNAILYLAYGDTPALEQMIENGTPEHVNVTKALVQAAPAMAELKDSIRQGIVYDADITDAIVEAFLLFSQIKSSSDNTIESFINQQDAFSEISLEVKLLLIKMNEATKAPKKLTSFLISYANKLKEYGNPNQVGLLGENPKPNQLEVLNRASIDTSLSTNGSNNERSTASRVNQSIAQPNAENGGESRVDETNGGGYAGSRSVSSNSLYNISPRQANLTGNDTKLTTAWKLIASQDDAFQLPISTKKTLDEIAADYDPTIKVELNNNNKTQRQWVIKVPVGSGFKEATVTEGKGRDKTIYLDISKFNTGSGGRAVYQMVGDYAHNAGKVFIGDPNGLSAIAQIRRTENMLSSALRWGTTDHLQPHELQLKPDSNKVTPLQWKVGDSEFNIDQMLRASMGNLLNQIPELGQIRYNFESQQFEEALPNGKIDTVTEADFGELAKSRGARAAQAGRTTLKRAVVSASILSGQGQAAWNAVLGNLIRQSGQQLDNPLQGILYGLNPSLDQTIHQVAADKQLSDLAEDALLSVFGESPKNQAIADRLLRQFFFDNFVQSETYPDSRSFVTARMNELRSSGALKLISDQYFSGNSSFKLKDDANRKPISAEKAEAAIRRILGDIPFETTIPNEIRSGAGEAADRVKGAFANGKIYIDTANIGSVAEAEALAVEELVHRGVANLFGPDYDARLTELHEAIGGEAGIRRFVEQHNIEMADDYFNQPATAQMDELLAHIEANQATLTVRVKRAFQRVLAHLRNAIRKLNTKVLHNVSDSDIVLIARMARNAAQDAVNNPMNDPRFGIRPEQESAAITEERMIAEEYSKRTRIPLSDRVKRSLYSGKSTLQEQKNTLRRELFKTDSDWWAGVKQWTKRYFYANSTLGRDIADARRSIDQNNAAEHQLVEQDLVLLDALIHNIYGKPSSELTADEQEQLHQALTGKEVFANSKHQTQLQYFRRRLDDLSQKLIDEKYREMQMRIDELNDEGKAAITQFAAEWLDPNYQYEEGQPIPKALMQIHRLQRQINTIEGNKGAYLNRSYQAFTDPAWAAKVRKKPVFKEAITFVMEQRAQQIKDDADSQITKAQTSISRIRARASKLKSLQDELSSVDKKRKFRATKLQQLQQVNATGLNADELAAHQRRISTTTKELADFNVESARLKQRINDITSGNFKLDKSETERIAKHEETIHKLQLEKQWVDQGKHEYLLTRDQAAVKLDDWLNGTAGQRSLLDFASGQGTNEGILKRRKDIPPVLRELLGEFTDPVYNYANTITQVADYVAKQQFQMSLRHFLKSMPNIAFIGSAPESIATKKFPETAAYDVLNDLLVDEQFMKDLEEFGVLPAIKDPYWLALTRLSTTVKLGKTAVAAPVTLARNFWSAGVSLVGAGHSPFSGASGAWKVIRNSRHRKDWLSGNILLSDKEAVELNQKYIRLGIRGDGASSNELARMFRDLQTAQDAAHAVKERSVGEKFVDWSLATYAFGDDFFKIICFEKDYADLVKAGLNPVEAEQEAARRTRDAMPTYSMIPRALQMLRRFPLAAPFVSFPWEQLRTTKNNLALIFEDYNRAKQTGNVHWKTMAYKRALGQFVANRGVWAIASFSAMVFGISDDDDDALNHFASDWHKGLLRVYFGADENGVASINFTPIVPSEYIWRAFRIGRQAWSEEGFGSGLYHTLEKLAEPFYQWNISFKGIMNLSMNRDDNGFPIYGKGNSLHDLIANPIDNADNWDKALGYFAKQLGPGIIQNINDFNRALSGSVADANAEDQNWIENYWNERAASLGGKVSRSGKEFTLVDAVAALLGFRVTHQNMVVLGQQAGQQTKNKVAAYSSEFKDAIGVTNPLSPEFLDSRLELLLANRERAFGKMMDLVQYYRNQGKPNAQILKDLYVDEGVTLSKKELKFLIEGKVPPFEVSKEVMSKALNSVEHISNPAERFRAKQALAERYRYVVRRAAEMQRTN